MGSALGRKVDAGGLTATWIMLSTVGVCLLRKIFNPFRKNKIELSFSYMRIIEYECLLTKYVIQIRLFYNAAPSRPITQLSNNICL
jgi:hypothetical protein